ncbi:MAG: hypothetical protein ABIE43_00020 [Patescibacteria group bacterium]
MEMFILIISLLIILVFLVFLAMQFFNMIFRGFAPYISTRVEVIKKVLAEIEINAGDNVYELGSGKAGFLRAVEKKYPKVNYIGIEYSFLLWFISKMQINLCGSKIKLFKKNIFKVDLSKADLIYCYLNPKMMERLEEKFKKECRPGTRIISYAFAIPDFNATKTIRLENGSKIYFYNI